MPLVGRSVESATGHDHTARGALQRDLSAKAIPLNSGFMICKREPRNVAREHRELELRKHSPRRRQCRIVPRLCQYLWSNIRKTLQFAWIRYWWTCSPIIHQRLLIRRVVRWAHRLARPDSLHDWMTFWLNSRRMTFSSIVSGRPTTGRHLC